MNKQPRSNSAAQPQTSKLAQRRRKRIKPPAGHPSDAELIASFTGQITKCPDGRAMGSMKSSDYGLTG
jgi:hypothetical protein